MAKNKELDKLEKEFDTFDQSIKDLTHDRMNEAPKQEVEPQTKLSSRELESKRRIFLKPKRTIASKEKFNDKFVEDWNFAKEKVEFIAENRELIGSMIESIWTKPFPGLPAEEWDVPVNRPVVGPRYLAEQIKKCQYHRLSMDEKPLPGNIIETGHMGTVTGKMVVDETINRLDAIPVYQNKSVFMGVNGK